MEQGCAHAERGLLGRKPSAAARPAWVHRGPDALSLLLGRQQRCVFGHTSPAHSSHRGRGPGRRRAPGRCVHPATRAGVRCKQEGAQIRAEDRPGRRLTFPGRLPWQAPPTTGECPAARPQEPHHDCLSTRRAAGLFIEAANAKNPSFPIGERALLPGPGLSLGPCPSEGREPPAPREGREPRNLQT